VSDDDRIPKWREDFPYESENDELITRRDATRFLLVVSGGLALGTGLVWVRAQLEGEPPAPRLALGAASQLAAGEWRVFAYPDEATPAILIRRESGELIAFQQKCTHLACPVAYERSSAEREECLSCHCHNGRFDVASGKGVSGPPRELRPLRRVALEVEGDRLFAVGLLRPGKA
jgi:nitrite reductase/ring-hydroxylating ferredoxin subunit